MAKSDGNLGFGLLQNCAAKTPGASQRTCSRPFYKHRQLISHIELLILHSVVYFSPGQDQCPLVLAVTV